MSSVSIAEDDFCYQFTPNYKSGGVFLINVLDSYVVSITRMCIYTRHSDKYPYRFYNYTKMRNNVFIQRQKNMGADDIVEPEGCDMEDIRFSVEFTYNNNGRLKVLKSLRKTIKYKYDSTKYPPGW
jgi:hypothetical protein